MVQSPNNAKNRLGLTTPSTRSCGLAGLDAAESPTRAAVPRLTDTDPIPYDQIRPRSITEFEDLGFACSKPEFAEYLIDAYYDQDAQMGRTYVFEHKGRIVGYVVLAMAHMPVTEQQHLNISTYGTVPALLISHLATHKQYERRGVCKNMLLWAISYGEQISESVGCRVVIVSLDGFIGFLVKSIKMESA